MRVDQNWRKRIEGQRACPCPFFGHKAAAGACLFTFYVSYIQTQHAQHGMMESAAKKLVRNLRPKQRLPPANIAPEGHATWKASSKTTEEPNASDLQLLSPQSMVY